MKRHFNGYAILTRGKGEHKLLWYTFSKTAERATAKYLNNLTDVAVNYKKPNYPCKAVKMTLEVIDATSEAREVKDAEQVG